MKRRCNNPNNNAYRNYGGRGITYCKEWEKFENFWRDMEEGYDDNLTLDRIDNNGNYCKENCRWVDYKTQMNNMRSNRIIEYKGKEYTLSELSEATGIKYWLLQLRLSKDMPAKEAVETPLHELEKITFNGETKTVVDFAKEKGMTYYQLKKRLMRGWSTERALTQPLRPPRYPKAAKQRFF